MTGKGPDTCPTCQRRVLRYPTAGTTNVSTFEEAGQGPWVIHPLTGHMNRIGRDALTDLTRYQLHTCLP